MKGIKVLQAATLGTFVLFVIVGLVVLFAFPEKMTAGIVTGKQIGRAHV